MSSFRKPQLITRQTPGSYISGVWVPGTDSTFTIMASVQPLSDKDLVNLPEGRRASDVIKLYTDTVLLTVEDKGENQQPDKIEWRGFDYEISSVSVRQMDVINHYRYFATKIPVAAV